MDDLRILKEKLLHWSCLNEEQVAAFQLVIVLAVSAKSTTELVEITAALVP